MPRPRARAARFRRARQSTARPRSPPLRSQRERDVARGRERARWEAARVREARARRRGWAASEERARVERAAGDRRRPRASRGVDARDASGPTHEALGGAHEARGRRPRPMRHAEPSIIRLGPAPSALRPVARLIGKQGLIRQTFAATAYDARTRVAAVYVNARAARSHVAPRAATASRAEHVGSRGARAAGAAGAIGRGRRGRRGARHRCARGSPPRHGARASAASAAAIARSGRARARDDASFGRRRTRARRSRQSIAAPVASRAPRATTPVAAPPPLTTPTAPGLVCRSARTPRGALATIGDASQRDRVVDPHDVAPPPRASGDGQAFVSPRRTRRLAPRARPRRRGRGTRDEGSSAPSRRARGARVRATRSCRARSASLDDDGRAVSAEGTTDARTPRPRRRRDELGERSSAPAVVAPGTRAVARCRSMRRTAHARASHFVVARRRGRAPSAPSAAATPAIVVERGERPRARTTARIDDGRRI